MAQSNIQIENNMGKENFIYITNDFARPAAKILKTYLDKSFTNPFLIIKKYENDKNFIDCNVWCSSLLLWRKKHK